MKTIQLLSLATLITCLAGQAPAEESMPMKPASKASAAAMPLVDGEIKELDPATGLIVLAHGDIPNLAMPGMTMGFDVVDKKMLRGLKVGDKVRFQAGMVGGKAMVTELKPVK